MAQHEIEIAQEGAAARHYDTLVDDVGGQFGRGVLERYFDRFDNRADGLRQAFRDLALADDDLLGHAVHQVAALNLHDPALAVFRHAGRADLLLDALGAALADQQVMIAADIGDDRLVHFVAANPDRAGIHDAAE